VFAGVGGNATSKVVKTLKRLEHLPFEGIVSVCPYYNRPSQDGLIQHFRAIAAATDRDVLIYNIPYRTAVNLSNESALELAELRNIVGMKDSSGNIAQSLDLLARKPADFAVLTGEDALYYTMMANGADAASSPRAT
jgi:4-hydroxy-tetrahydrodipicolinate synthase